jgi:hypothetical protein
LPYEQAIWAGTVAKRERRMLRIAGELMQSLAGQSASE